MQGACEAANENAVMHVLTDGAHVKVGGGRIFLLRRGGAPAAGAVVLAVVDGEDRRHTVQLSAEEARFLALQLTAPAGRAGAA